MSEKENEYLISYLLGELNSEEALAVEKVLASDTELNAQFISLRETWERSGLLYDVQNINVKGEWKKFKVLAQKGNIKSIQFTPRKHILNPGILAAASIALLLAVGAVIFFLSTPSRNVNVTSEKIAYKQVYVPRGQRGNVVLPDGSRVVLNSQSRLTYPAHFRANRRDVVLEGEGYFEVTHDKSRPFHVITTLASVEVLGTVFNVSAYPDDSQVQAALLSGKVSFSGNNTRIKEVLAPHEVATLHKNDNNITKASFSFDVYSLWRTGEFIFYNEQPQQVFKKLERYFDKEFIYNDKDIVGKRLTAHFRKNESLDKILKVTGEALELRFKVVDNKIRVVEFKRHKNDSSQLTNE